MHCWLSVRQVCYIKLKVQGELHSLLIVISAASYIDAFQIFGTRHATKRSRLSPEVTQTVTRTKFSSARTEYRNATVITRSYARRTQPQHLPL